MFRRHHLWQRTLGSKRDPCKRNAPTPPPPIMPATQATHSILYLRQELRQIKWPRVIV